MINEMKSLIAENGDRMEVVSIDRIKVLQEEIAKFRDKTELDGYQQWVVDKLYYYKGIPDYTKSVIIVAVPRPAAYANITFNAKGREYKIYGTVAAPFTKSQTRTKKLFEKKGFKIEAGSCAGRLPLKRLAVQSSLAEYGKNNITYIEGMGSYFALYAFFTDLPCKKDNWRDITVSPQCGKCNICQKNCPTGAIRKNNFIIETWKCLSAMNENTADFPDWLPPESHHTTFDCLKCQVCCPLNAQQNETLDVCFNEAETKRILKGKPYKDVSSELKKKINSLDLDRWASIPRNIQLLFALMDKGHKLEL